jgi:hypothetical protein
MINHFALFAFPAHAKKMSPVVDTVMVKKVKYDKEHQ